MPNYSNIIEEECSSKKSKEIVSQILPILVEWAKAGYTNKTYGDLNKLIGYKKGIFSGIGYQLELVSNVLKRLAKECNEDIPTLNTLIINAKTGIPSDGFKEVFPGYDAKLSIEEKRSLVKKLNSEAINYKNWEWVLASLGLKPKIDIDESSLRSTFTSVIGGEGPDHKAMKEYVATHPESLGIKTSENGENEHVLLSGDRLDVYFKQANIAVEVKPLSSPDPDILRGIFQCVKYKAIIDAEAAYRGEKADGKTILVIEGVLSKANRAIKDCLGIKVVENFKYK